MTTAANVPMTSGFDAGWGERALERATAAGEPRWALDRRRTAAALAAALPFPSHEHELWRRTDFRAIQAELPKLDAFTLPARARSVDELPAAILERLGGDAKDAALVVQRDGAIVFEQVPQALSGQGVIVCSLDRALREHAAKLEPALGSLLPPDYDRYTAIGMALRGGGTFVWVPDGVEAALPIRARWFE